MQSIKEYFTKMFVFGASATRKQFWIPYFTIWIITAIVRLATGANDFTNTQGEFELELNGRAIAFGIYLVVVWIASFTLKARRLHDTNRSNWWILIELIPIIGWIWLFILFLLPSKQNTRWPMNQSDVH